MAQVPASTDPLPGGPPEGEEGHGAPVATDAPATLADAAAESARAAERADRVVGLVIVAVGFCLALMVSWWASVKATPETSKAPAPPTTAGLQGFPASVDPLLALEVARGLTERSMLREIEIERVGSDGTVNLTSDSSRVRYTFQDAPGEGAHPPRDAGTLARRHYCGRQSVEITAGGIGAQPDVSSATCPNPPVEALPDPRCGPREVWQIALRKRANADHLARMQYYRAAVGPAWRFTSLGGPVSFSVYGDCGRELSPTESRPAPY